MTGCRMCGNDLEQPAKGRRRTYCSDTCRIAARRIPRADPDAAPGPLSSAIAEALEKLPPGDDPRRRILSIELVAVARELDADSCGRPSLIHALERLVVGVFPSDARLADDEMDLDSWWQAMGGRQ